MTSKSLRRKNGFVLQRFQVHSRMTRRVKSKRFAILRIGDNFEIRESPRDMALKLRAKRWGACACWPSRCRCCCALWARRRSVLLKSHFARLSGKHRTAVFS
jgi:hypothetical protein